MRSTLFENGRVHMKPIPLFLMFGAVLVSAIALAADAKFDAVDQDQNGSLSMAEVFLAMPTATAEQFTKADADADGQLSEAEFTVAVSEGVLPES